MKKNTIGRKNQSIQTYIRSKMYPFYLKHKPFPTVPKKLKNFIFKLLVRYYEGLHTSIDQYIIVYKHFMKAFSGRIQDPEQVLRMEQKIDNSIIELELKKYENVLVKKLWSLQEVESDIRIGMEYGDFFNERVELRVFAELTNWKQKYGEPEKEWSAFTKDEQNVHTTVISNQMNEALEILHSYPIPKHQKTVDEICTAFVNELRVDSISKVYEDMKSWGNTAEIYKPNDYLYRRTLRGLWAKINTYEGEIRTELLKRLWEECSEAAGLCATGHICRLTNVLVGFDERFRSQVSIKEMFQTAMANISQSDISEEEKREKAETIMNEWKIPEEERQVWLDAF